MRPAFFPFCTAALVLFLVGSACGRVGLDRAGTVVDAGGLGGSADRAQEASTPVPPFATILRVTNVGASDVRLFEMPSFACPWGFTIQGGAPFDQPTSIENPDTTCDCGACAATPGRRNCVSVDLICEDPPLVIAPGAHYDFGWDGTAMIWLSPPPADTPCIGPCSEFIGAPAARYSFALQQGTQRYMVESSLPAPGGVIEIPVGAP